ncbi:MAG TPA: DNA-binding protein [Thermodesulfobacteriota bacterium]|nr:DNA-binding protein [Thermodesulfobacteriota bacterium]
MSFDWKEYFNLALVLHGLYPRDFVQEAAFRSSVSRAYYAAFCCARNYARDNHGFPITRSSREHKDIRNLLRSLGMTQLARKLDVLRQWRNSCDYEDTVPNISHLVGLAIHEARGIIGKLT